MLCFTHFSNKNGQACTKKIVKTLIEFFHNIKLLIENTTIHYGVTIDVILSTVRQCGGGSAAAAAVWLITNLHDLQD